MLSGTRYSTYLGLMSLTLKTAVKNTGAKGKPVPRKFYYTANKAFLENGASFHFWAESSNHCCKTLKLGCANSQGTTGGRGSSVFPSLLSHSMI